MVGSRLVEGKFGGGCALGLGWFTAGLWWASWGFGLFRVSFELV